MPPDSHPILACAAAKAWEAGLLTDEAAEWPAMQRAGAALARAVTEDFREIGGLPAAARLLVLAGKGHNGGDALLAAQALLAAHPAARADVLLAFGEAALRPLARRALLGLRESAGAGVREVTLSGLKEELSDYELCLDGVFGFQFHPPLDEATAELLAWVNTHPRLRVRAAVDLPSGLGEANAGTVFRADFTYATGIVKAPLVDPANAPFVGRLRYLDLGFFAPPWRSLLTGEDCPVASTDGKSPASRLLPVDEVERVEPASPFRVLLPSLLAPLSRLRPAQSDKRTYGHLLVVGGSRRYPGAVLMTVQAALRSGVGLLTAFVPASLVPEYAARFPEAMWVGVPETAEGGISAELVAAVRGKLPRASALVIGPGLGTDAVTLGAVAELVRTPDLPPLLLDADALRPEILAAAAGRRVIVTPHAGEAARLWGRAGLRPAASMKDGTVPWGATAPGKESPAEDRGDCPPPPSGELVAVRKGSPTRVVCLSPVKIPADSAITAIEVGRGVPAEPTKATAHRDGSPNPADGAGIEYFSFFGGPVLARGGSGDLLAGLIGGLLAQAPDDLLLAACRGVVWHGLAADCLARAHGQVAVQTTQLLDYLPPALHAYA